MRAWWSIDPTTNHSVSNFRLHKAFPAAADRNPVMRAMLQFVAEILAPSELSALLSEHGEPARFEAMVSAYRVTRGGHERFELGEPGPEGIHQDSADLTVVSLMDRRNVAEDAGANRVWSLAQPCGKPSAEDVASGRMLAETTLRTDSTRSSSSTATSSTRRARSPAAARARGARRVDARGAEAAEKGG